MHDFSQFLEQFFVINTYDLLCMTKYLCFA